jgi:UDP-2,3-diacylglucosamine pyrophosphatase LpxH
MKSSKKRKLDVLVLSDIHLGTFGCRAKELMNYLKTVDPKVLILNGDIIDIWQFNKRYFPKTHMKVVLHLTSLLAQNTKVYYVTGNHDEMLRKFKGFRLGSFEIVNKLLLDIQGKKAWIFHGDVFDVTMKHSKWLAKLGGMGYELLIMLNTMVNWVGKHLGRGRISFSKRIKNSVKSAVKHINNFEETAAEIAMSNGYDYVVCGHIHQPQIRKIENKEGQEVMYLNSGDWIENLTALECKNGEWRIYDYFKDPVAQKMTEKEGMKSTLSKANYKNKQLFDELLEEFQFVSLLNGVERK